MNNDLISREALKKELQSRLFPQDYSTTLLLGTFNDLIDNAPTVEINWRFYYDHGYKQAERDLKRLQGEWGKWIISEIQCPSCLGYFQPDCYSTEELKKCPNCGADMRGAE